MTFAVGLFIYAIAVFVVAAILQVIAKSEHDFHLPGASAADARNIFRTSEVLRGGWTRSDGRGQIKIRPGFLLGSRKGRQQDHQGPERRLRDACLSRSMTSKGLVTWNVANAIGLFTTARDVTRDEAISPAANAITPDWSALRTPATESNS